MIGIKYIGKRETHTDNIYGTNLVWEPDQVHNVENGIAAKMLVHADVYKDAKTVKGEKEARAQEKQEEVEEDPLKDVPLPSLDAMDKNALQLFAQQHFGEQLDGRMTVDTMRDRVAGLINSKGRG